MGGDQPAPVTGILVAEGFFKHWASILRRDGYSGPRNSCKHAPPAALLSYPFWKRQIARRSRYRRTDIDLNRTAVTVVGVLPDTFDFGSVFSPGAKVDLFTPVHHG